MIPDDLDPLEQHLLAAFETITPPQAASSKADPEAEALWRAQIESRNCDHAARWLQKEKRSFYSIGSAGHESNATVAPRPARHRPCALALPLRRVLFSSGCEGGPRSTSSTSASTARSRACRARTPSSRSA